MDFIHLQRHWHSGQWLCPLHVHPGEEKYCLWGQCNDMVGIQLLVSSLFATLNEITSEMSGNSHKRVRLNICQLVRAKLTEGGARCWIQSSWMPRFPCEYIYAYLSTYFFLGWTISIASLTHCQLI